MTAAATPRASDRVSTITSVDGTVAGGDEDGVGAIAIAALAMVAAHTVVVLDVADHRLDRGASSPGGWPW